MKNLGKILSTNGGLIKSFLVLLRTDSLKFGEYVGRDALGNRYYQNNYYFLGSNRWVIYSNAYGYDYDGSQVHYRWFRWLHHMTDYTPCQDKRPVYPWMLPHTENPTGTKDQYVPYSTTKPKITPWNPKL